MLRKSANYMNFKINLTIVLLLLLSCDRELDKNFDEVFIIKKIIFDNDGRFDASFGLMNSKGKQLVGLNYKMIHYVGSDYFIGEKNNHDQQYFKLSNENFLFEKEFEEAKPFSANDLAKVKSKGKWGFINKDGDYVVPPLYDLVGEFSENRAAILVENKIGFINEEGKIIIEPKYDLPMDLDFNYPENQIEMYRFTNGLCPFNLKGKYGYINYDGKIEIDPIFSKATSFNKEYAIAVIEENEETISGIINKNGVWKVKPQFESIFLGDDYFIGSFPVKKKPGRLKLRDFSDSVSVERYYFSYFRYDGTKMINEAFNWEGTELKTHSFSENKAFICPDSCGYINKKGEYIIRPKFSPRQNVLFINGMAVVGFNNNKNSYIPEAGYKGKIISYSPVGIIDEFGKIKIPPVFIAAKIYSSGIIEVMPKEQLVRDHLLQHVFYIDYNGNYVWNGYEER